MRFDEDDPKKPRPVPLAKKHLGAPEAAEANPWRHLRKDHDRDRHRHVT
jgi:hypothetical protein